jgi:hypothetical protein
MPADATAARAAADAAWFGYHAAVARRAVAARRRMFDGR